MRYLAFCTLLLATSEPLLAYAEKVVLVIPQQTRRSLGTIQGSSSWRPVTSRYRKSSHGGEAHYHHYYGPPANYHSKKFAYKAPSFPHGGDDFDQGHGPVNHVHIPHGKGITHGISLGKGYIPYDQIKGSFSLGHERNPSIEEYKQSEQEYSPTSFVSEATDYSPSGQYSYESSQSNAYFPDAETALQYNERRNDQQKLYSSRSIEKNLGTNNPVPYSTDKDTALYLLGQKASELYRNAIPQHQGSVTLPSGVPSPTIGGNKDGVVFSDSVALDEYQQKLQEMTKSWAQFLPNTAATGNNHYQNHQVSASYTTGVSPSSFVGGSNSWTLNFAQPKQGYDVKEENAESPPDFRTMPIQTSPYQSFSVAGNVALPGVGQTIHG